VRNTRSIISLVLALFALSAVAAASASAAELKQTPEKGKFTVSSGESKFQTTSGKEIKCKKDSGSGETTGETTDKSTTTFEECSATEFGIKASCSSSGAKSGDIETKINSELVWLHKSGGSKHEKAGEKLALAETVKITCSIVKVEVTGATLCPIEPVNTKTKTFTLGCKESKGVQEWTEYENEKGEITKEVFTKSSGTESGLESTESLKFETEGEIQT
jgi:hypothetical protein